MGRGRSRRRGAWSRVRRASDLGVLMARDLRGADPAGAAGAAGRDRRAGPRDAASADAGARAGPAARAGQPGAGPPVGGAQRRAIPAGPAAGGWMGPVARRGGRHRHRRTDSRHGRRALVPRHARRDSLRGRRRVGVDRRRARRPSTPPRCGACMDARAAGTRRLRIGSVCRLSHRGGPARPVPTPISWWLDDRRASRRRGRWPRDPHPDLHRRPAARPNACRRGDRAPGARRPPPAFHQGGPGREAGGRLAAERGRVPDLRPAFKALRVPAKQAPAAAALERSLEDQLSRAATRAFRTAFLVAAGLALLALAPALALRDRRRP